MAFVERKRCPVCQPVVEGEGFVHHQRFVNGKCDNCEGIKQRAELLKWESMSYDERLLDLHRRLQKLEAGPSRF